VAPLTSLSRVLIVGALLVSARTSNAGQCAPVLLVPQIATPTGAQLPPGAGILLADGPLRDTRVGAAPSGAIKDWRFVAGKRRTRPKVQRLAPGLVVLEAAGTRLEDARKARLLAFTRTPTPVPPLDAPAVTGITAETTGGRRPVRSVRVALRTAPPTTRYLVAYDTSGTAPPWGVASPTPTTRDGYVPGHGPGLPDGTLPTAAGDKIQLAWVELTDRRSAVSPPVDVAVGRGPGGDRPFTR